MWNVKGCTAILQEAEKRPQNIGFEINPYKPCIANMMVTGAQCIVCWHVENLKVSHVDVAVFTTFSLKLEDLYKERVNTYHGKVLDYLGIYLEYGPSAGALLVSMIKYLTKVLEEWSEELRGLKINPLLDNLFVIRDNDTIALLPKEMVSEFHQMVAELLYLCTRARLDMQILVLFLTTRVKLPAVNDWGNPRHYLLYLKGTCHMKRYLLADSLLCIQWYIDALYEVHWEWKEHIWGNDDNG